MGPTMRLGKRFVGQLFPLVPVTVAGADDDVVGFVLGWEPGDGELFSPKTLLEANYVLIDWKGVDQSFDFDDGAGG